MEITLALMIVSAATAVILNLGRLAAKLPMPASRLHYINTQLTFQAFLLAVALLLLMALY